MRTAAARTRKHPGPAATRATQAHRGEGKPRASLVEQAYSTIRARILDNVYPPGYQALEQGLAEELGISRTPVREALIRLSQEGLVDVVPRHGMRVLPVSPVDMSEIYEILTALEGLAAELVASRRPAESDIAPLVQATRDMEKALKGDDLEGWAAADERFHRHLVDLSGNRLLAEVVGSYWDRAHRARMFTLRLRPKPVNSTREHMALVDRIRAGDARGALEANRAHRGRASRELLEIFERYRLSQL
ncbi:MAG: GntR family transcriptional regulator [Burkholderiales bacterium]|jgi:DNA-binding GntR family transcriptional regulator|nr:GntR family transcriptional regulator [Burkholderiales bacterium]